MTTWTDISNAAVAVGGIPSSTTVTALRDNPLALAESASGAPIVASSWHPYNKVSVGDGKDGVFYDFSLTGAQTTITSPDFDDGYEYRFFGILSGTFNLYFYKSSEAAYEITLQSLSNVLGDWFDFTIPLPRIAREYHYAVGEYMRSGNLSPGTILAKSPNNAASPSTGKIDRIQFSGGTSAIGNKIWMFRRREYASVP